MNSKFKVEVTECKSIHQLPDAWSSEQYRELLDTIEYEGAEEISDGELAEMTAMALTDLEPEEAVKAVLKVRFGDAMTSGQRQDLSADMQEGKIWEEYGNMAFHEELFNAAWLLHQAFDDQFPKTVCASVKLKVSAANTVSKQLLEKPSAAFVTRLLVDGMDEHNAIKRLFQTELESETFKEANDIIWRYEVQTISEVDGSTLFHLYTSWNWVDELKGVETYESTAHEDE